MFNLIDTTEGDKIDFWLLTNDAFDQSRFERKIEENIFGFIMKISTPEDTILSKLKWIHLSGGAFQIFAIYAAAGFTNSFLMRATIFDH